MLKKLRKNRHFKIPVQGYLHCNELSAFEKKNLFKLRSYSYNFKSNFKNQYGEEMWCRICNDKDSIEDEFHTFFSCKVLLENTNVPRDVSIEHIFGSLEEQIGAIKYFSPIIKRRETILDLRSNTDMTENV